MSTLTPKEARALWVEALESGEYKQGRDKLYNSHRKEFCCLGVGVKVAQDQGIIPLEPITGGGLLGIYHAVRRWLGLSTHDGAYKDNRSLAVDNDSGLTFTEIAAVIRSEPKGLFVKDLS